MGYKEKIALLDKFAKQTAKLSFLVKEKTRIEKEMAKTKKIISLYLELID